MAPTQSAFFKGQLSKKEEEVRPRKWDILSLTHKALIYLN